MLFSINLIKAVIPESYASRLSQKAFAGRGVPTLCRKRGVIERFFGWVEAFE